ncbi:O-antigen ligase family protein [Streptomyces sp. NPDC047072]|uniref:O-antigen ligase family protein n=1 Tax=Streptomyces sp. NPDC047072 TaxID=3154809 RepID=UPI00340C49B5
MSVLDVLLLVAALTLALDCAVRPLDIGYRRLFPLLCVPMVICGLSLLWSQDRAATLRATLIYIEGIVAYLFVLRELDGMSPARVMTYIKRYSYLVIVPAVLLLLHTPGFAPAQPGLVPTSGDYLSYYSRLSHPILGRSNNLATVLAFFVPVLFYWGHARHDRRYTRAGFLTLTAVILTLSRGVVLALLVTALLAALGSVVRSHRIEGRTLGKAVIAVSGVFAGVMLLRQFNPYTREFFGDRFSGSNILIRSDLVQKAIGKIADRPLLGYGGGATPDQDPYLAIGVHNTYLQQVVFFGLFLGLLVSLSLIGVAVFFFSRWRAGGINRAIGFALLAQLLIFATESSFEGTDLRLIFYLSIGLVTALSRACEAECRGERLMS